MAKLELSKHIEKTANAMVEQRSDKIKVILLLFLLTVVILVTTAGVLLFKNHPEAKSAAVKNFLASAFNNREEYDGVFSELQKPAEDANAVAGIISHHFLAKGLIADFYNKIGSDKIDVVFLVSPDHFNNYFDPATIAYTSNSDWNTPFGILQADGDAIKILQAKGKIETQDSVLGLEQGIYVEIPFIKKFFPNAKIVPLVLKNNLSAGNFVSLGNEIKQISGGNSIFLVSSDFSHDATVSKAKTNDEKSINVLKNFNVSELGQVTNDCSQCLAALSGFLGDGLNSFFLLANENSFDVSGQDKNSVTSYVSGYYAQKDYTQIMLAGDLMFDRGIRYYAENNGGNNFIFEKVSDLLLQNDLNVVNLEGPITDNKSKSADTAPETADNYFFTFDPSVAQTLFNQNIKLVDLGNNHILNFGSRGMDQTKNYLSQAGVDYFGAPTDDRSVIKNVGGLKIAFVSYNEFYGNIALEQSAVINEIKNVKPQADVVIVFCHWGVEYSKTPSVFDIDLAHQFVDAGADLVVGSHPHVIQTTEIYKNKRIYYSLGNFIFDQYFNEDVRNGLGVIVKIDKDTKQMDFTEQNFYLQSNGQTLLR